MYLNKVSVLLKSPLSCKISEETRLVKALKNQ